MLIFSPKNLVALGFQGFIRNLLDFLLLDLLLLDGRGRLFHFHSLIIILVHKKLILPGVVIDQTGIHENRMILGERNLFLNSFFGHHLFLMPVKTELTSGLLLDRFTSIDRLLGDLGGARFF